MSPIWGTTSKILKNLIPFSERKILLVNFSTSFWQPKKVDEFALQFTLDFSPLQGRAIDRIVYSLSQLELDFIWNHTENQSNIHSLWQTPSNRAADNVPFFLLLQEKIHTFEDSNSCKKTDLNFRVKFVVNSKACWFRWICIHWPPFFNINKDVQYFQMNNSAASANFNRSISVTKKTSRFSSRKKAFLIVKFFMSFTKWTYCVSSFLD